jgi:hypothetical protein
LKGTELTVELRDLENFTSTFMICYLNGFEDAKEKLINAKQLLNHTLWFMYCLKSKYANFEEK